MTQAIRRSFEVSAVARTVLTVDFDGGNKSSDAGALVVRSAEQRVGIVRPMAAACRDRRGPTRVRHQMTEFIGARVFGFGCGYEDGTDQNMLRDDPAMKMAVGRLPEMGAALAS